MNMWNALLVGLLFLASSFALAGRPNPVHLILLSGQSNMARGAGNDAHQKSAPPRLGIGKEDKSE